MEGKRVRSAGIVRAGILVSGALLLVACTAILGLDETKLRDDVVADASDEARGIEEEAGAPGLSLAPAVVVLRRGASADVTVTLPSPVPDGATVRVAVAGVPAGVQAAPPVLEAGATTGVLRLEATAGASLGRVVVSVRLEGVDVAPKDLRLLVAGQPGSLDETFDGDGLAEVGGDGRVTAAVVDDGDRIVVGGARGAGGWLVERLGENGTPDGAFASALPPLPADGEVAAMARTATGGLVVAGWTTTDGGGAVPTVLRLLASGAPDGSFGNEGLVRVAVAPGLPPGSGARALALAALPDDGVVLAGDVGLDGLVARLAADGALAAEVHVPTSRLVGVANVGDTVFVGGTETFGPTTRFLLERRFLDGGLDPSFGTGGSLRFATTYEAAALAVDPSGVLALVGGAGATGGTYAMGEATTGGVQVFARGLASAPGARLHAAVTSSPSIVAAGHGTGPNAEARVARVLRDGGLDPAFGAAGFAVLDPGDAGDGVDLSLFAAAVHVDGRIVVAGRRTDRGPVVLRLWP